MEVGPKKALQGFADDVLGEGVLDPDELDEDEPPPGVLAAWKEAEPRRRGNRKLVAVSAGVVADLLSLTVLAVATATAVPKRSCSAWSVAVRRCSPLQDDPART